MEITAVEATTHQVPVRLPLRDEERTRKIVFVRVTTDTGITGYGFTAKPQWFGVRAIINREMAPLLETMDPHRPERIWLTLQERLNKRMKTGAWSAAISAVDIALWDIAGKSSGIPTWKLLGGARQSVPAYITFGLKRYDTDELVELATKFVDEGHHRLKMKVGVSNGTDPHADARRVAAVRGAVGDDVELMVDANCELPLSTALQLCSLLEPYDLTWFEEPILANDTAGLASLRSRSSIPIAAGQEAGNRIRHRELISGGSIDIAQPNVCFVGGFTEARKVAGLAHSHNLMLANGCGWPHHNSHLHAAMPNGWRVEFHYVHWKVGEAIYRDPPAPIAGSVTLSDEPGLGLTPDDDALADFRIE